MKSCSRDGKEYDLNEILRNGLQLLLPNDDMNETRIPVTFEEEEITEKVRSFVNRPSLLVIDF